jgi:hypothetical protein
LNRSDLRGSSESLTSRATLDNYPSSLHPGGDGRHRVMLGASAPPGGVPDEQQREEAEVRDPSRSGHQYR